MAKKKRQLKKEKSGKWFAIVGVIMLFVTIITLTVGVGSSWFTNGNALTWFNYWGKGAPITENVQPVAIGADGETIEPSVTLNKNVVI